MKLLSVSHFFESHGGGIERVAARLCREFVRSGHEVTWAASAADALPLNLTAVPLACINPTEGLTGLPMPIPGPRAIRALARAVRTSDAVIVHDALYVTSILAMAFGKSYGKPVLLIQHIAAITFASQALRFLMRCANFVVTRPMLAVADKLVFISDVVRIDLIGDPPRREYRLLYNGVDTAIFNPGVKYDRAATRSDFNLPRDAVLAIFVGRFVEKKGLAVLRALAVLRPDLHVALVGSGPIRPELWGLTNVHVLGPLPQDRVATLYRAAELLVLPSVGEGYPLVIQEAMACGLPIVCGETSARADPGAASYLRGVRIDLVDPKGSAARCAATINGLADHPVDRAKMAAYAAATYDWTAMAAGLVAYLSAPVETLATAVRGTKRR